MIIMSRNEYPQDVVSEVKDEIIARIRNTELNRYPGQGETLKKVACAFGVKDGEVLLGNGSDELIQLLALKYGLGKKSVILDPSFSMYRKCLESVQSRIVDIPLDSNWQPDLQLLLSECEDADLVFIANPNNPTGALISQEDICQIAALSKGITVVDEAYGDFAGTSSLPLLASCPRLLVLRTLSKGWGLAGLRLGMVFGSRDKIADLNEARLPYNINCLSIAALDVMLETRSGGQLNLGTVISERQRMHSEMSRIRGVSVWPSVTNFILFASERPASQTYEELLRRGIEVRKFTEGALARALRVTVCRPRENDMFLKALRELS